MFEFLLIACIGFLVILIVLRFVVVPLVEDMIREHAEKALDAIDDKNPLEPVAPPPCRMCGCPVELVRAQRKGGGITKFRRCCSCGDVDLVPGDAPNALERES